MVAKGRHVGKKNADRLTTYTNHFLEFAEDAAIWKDDKRTPLVRLLSNAGPSRYADARIKKVLRDTVRKEEDLMQEFFAWGVKEGFFLEAPPRSELPEKTLGVRSGPQRETPVQITQGEGVEIISRMPMFGCRGGRHEGKNTPQAFRVRDDLLFQFELALRPEHCYGLLLGAHHTLGARSIFIPGEIDKKGIPKTRILTNIARQILERVCTEDAEKIAARGGVVFGEHDHRIQLKRVAIELLGEARGVDFARNDFRHAAARETLLVEGGSVLHTQSALNHASAATTANNYLHATELAAHTVLNAASEERLANAAPRAGGSFRRRSWGSPRRSPVRRRSSGT